MIKKLLFISVLVTISAWATPVAIYGVIQRADSSYPSGYANISWQAFTNAQGVIIPAGNIRQLPIVNGVVSVSLEPNVGATPSGTSYRVTYTLNGSPVYQRVWYVNNTNSPPIPLSQVEFPVPGLVGTTAIVNPSQLTPAGAALGNALCWNGNYWAPGSCISSGLPTATGQLEYLRTKPNSGNDSTLEFSSLSSQKSTDFIFPTQFPSGSVAIGSNTKTLTPCPIGLNGSDSSHYLYLSGGAGIAEPVLITGGTCTSGASSGTVIFTAGNTHSGAWGINTASAGIYEGCNTSSTGATVTIPAGDYNIYGRISPAKGCTIDGLGTPSDHGPSGAATLHMQTAGIPMFDITTYATTIKNLQLEYGSFPAYTVNGVVATSGSIGIRSLSSYPNVEDVIINNFYVGQVSTGIGISDHRVWSLGNISDCFQISGAGAGLMEWVFGQACGGNGFTLGAQSAIQWHNVTCFNNGGWGIQINNGTAFQMDNVDCENDYLGELHISGGVASVGFMQDFIFQGGGASVSWGTNTQSPGIRIDSGAVVGLSLVNGGSSGNQGSGIELEGSEVNLSNVQVYTNGGGAVSGHQYCLNMSGSLNTISGLNCYSQLSSITGSSNVVVGSQFANINSASPAVTFGGSSLRNTFCDNFISNAGGAGISWTAGASASQCSNSIIGGVTGIAVIDAGGPAIQNTASAPMTCAFANLATCMPANGQSVYCPDCTIANPCAGAGSGAIAKRLNGIMVCN